MARAIPDLRHWRVPLAEGIRAAGPLQRILPAQAARLAHGARLVLAAAVLQAAAIGATRAAEPGPAWTAPALPPCTCRAEGRVFDMGEEACLATAEGPRMAVCAMDQNVTSWKPTARTCPSADRTGGMPHAAS